MQEEMERRAPAGMSQVLNEADIVELVTSYVGEGIDRDVPLAQQGLDSLAAMELHQKLQVGFCHTNFMISIYGCCMQN